MRKLYKYFLLLFLIACEKEESEILLIHPSSYHSTLLESTSKVRLFSKNGEITDQNIIDKYTKNDGGRYLFANGFRSEIPLSDADNIQIKSASEAIFKAANSNSSTWKEFTIRQSRQLIEFISKDTISSLVHNDESLNHQLALKKGLLKYSNEYEELLLISPRPDIVYYEYKVVQKLIATLKSNNLNLPTVNFVMYNPDGRSGWRSSRRENNELKDQLDFSQFKASDTIAVQTFNVIYEKD